MSASAPRIRSAAILAAFLLGGAAAAQAAPASAVTLDEGIRCQEALERVYWTHRSKGQGRSFEQAVPRTLLRRSAEDAVLKTEALRRFWGMAITPGRLQAE